MKSEEMVQERVSSVASEQGGAHPDKGDSEKVNYGPEPPKFSGWESGKGEK